MTNRALIVVDLQNDYFATGKLPLVGIDTATANAAQVIDSARTSGDVIVHIRHEFTSSDAPFFAPGSQGAQIHFSVLPTSGEQTIVKHHANAFRDTVLKEILDAQHIDNVVIVGAMSHMCIDATARAAADFGYRTMVVHDACATRDLEFDGVKIPAAQVHAAFMAALTPSYATLVHTADHVSR
jgi:nicotinamidase-related amidase